MAVSEISLEALKERLDDALATGGEVHRLRLMLAMTEAVAHKGYAATTIGDVVALAKVSRRTFYEQFADKEECYLAAYDLAAELIMGAIAGAVSNDAPWEERLLAGVDAYLRNMAQDPPITRVFLVEVLGAGPRALERRRIVHRRFAEQLRTLVAAARADSPGLRDLTPPLALALVAGINELVLLAVEEGRTAAEIEGLRDAAAELVRAVTAPA